jgi:acetoin:2,6-dichlorophenolindophenol oxidoreductase subunit beta
MAKMRYAEALNLALCEEMRRDKTVFMFGEDIGRYGGVFKVSKGLMEEFGENRIRDTPISEQALTAMAVTAAMAGTKPILEIMYADFIPLTLDALVNQASVFNYLWEGQVQIPFVLRTQGGGGVGTGAQHAKSLDSFLTHIPGIKVVAPVTPADARGLLKAAIRDPQPVIFLEHKLLYNMRGEVPEDEDIVPIGKAKTVRDGTDISIFATSKMVLEAEAAAKELAKDAINAEVIDLRTLRPLDLSAIKASIAKTHHAVVVNEGWTFSGYVAELSATIMDHCFDDLDAPVERVAMPDMPIPYSEPLEVAVIPNAAKIAAAARKALA